MVQATDDGATIDNDNVRPFPGAGPDPKPRARTRRKDRRAAGRRAKFRSKIKPDRDATPDKDAPPPSADAPPIAPTEIDTPPAERVTIIRVVAGIASYVAAIAIDVVAYTTAIGLASVAALFSIKGMVQLFPGAPLLIIAMASMMEASKLVTAGWLARRWHATMWFWRLVLVVLVAGLALINAAGVYAQLVAAHVGDRGAATSDIEVKDAALAAKIDVQAHKVADLDRRLNQVDTAIEEAARRGKTNAALSAMEGQRKARGALVDERNREAGTLAALKAERAGVAAKGRQIETEAAPIRYVAELVGADTDSEKAIRWLIALMVLCCDPLGACPSIRWISLACEGRIRFWLWA
jgi:hypothetical protein